MRRWPLLPAALLLGALAQAEAVPGGDSVERGRQIYMETTSPAGGEIVAVLGEASAEIPGSAVPCSGCHGRDGRGRPEGGVTPTDITWRNLTRPYGLVRATGNRVPAYDERSLARAIKEAVDPAGVSFHVAMPRYRMSPRDLEDLVAFVKTLGQEADPGVSETSVRIALLLPPPGPLAGLGEAVRAAVAARFAEQNAAGGVFGRRVDLISLQAEGTAAERRPRIRELLAAEQAFAAVAPFFAGDDAALAELFETTAVPAIGPFMLHPSEELAVQRHLFFLSPGIADQARALVRHARETAAAEPRPALVAPEDESLNAAAKAVELACAGWRPASVHRYRRADFNASAMAQDLAARGADPVLFLGSGPEALALLRAAEPLSGWRPRLFLTALAADGSLFAAPSAFDNRIFLALPAQPGEGNAATSARYRALKDAHGLPAEHRSAQLSGLAAAEVLLEGLLRCGRELTRVRLIENLEGLRQLDTGYAPPLSFGPSRRLGARGAYLFRLDLSRQSLEPAGGWLEAE